MKKAILVWDLSVRVFHWSLVCLVIALWYTSDGERGLIEYHMQLGYCVIFLITYRLLWGVLGSHFAKFKHFALSWQEVREYLFSVKTNTNKAYVGHNPLGSLMVILMLALFLLQAGSGLFISDDVFSSGPYHSLIDNDFAKILKDIHSITFDIIFILSVVHVLAVLWHVFVKKHALVKAMFTGYKIIESNLQITKQTNKLLLSVILALVVAGVVYWLVVLNVPVVEDYY